MRNKKLFIAVICPGGSITGGPEALHQLAEAIDLTHTAESGVKYIGAGGEKSKKHYSKQYKFRVIEEIPHDCNAVVIPEYLDPQSICVPENCKKIIWWLSATRTFPLTKYIGTYHAAQSHYAQKILAEIGIPSMPLSDYIQNCERTVGNKKKTNKVILVNGAKSALIAARIKIRSPSAKLFLIQKMSRDEVYSALEQCSVYLDFGAHPGRDRLPREAALRNCIVIVNGRGTAADGIDVNVSDRYKVISEDPDELIDLLSDCLNNFERSIIEFQPYVNVIRCERKKFQAEVEALVSGIINENLEATKLDGICEMASVLDSHFLACQREKSEIERRANLFAGEVLFSQLMLGIIPSIGRLVYRQIKRIRNVIRRSVPIGSAF